MNTLRIVKEIKEKLDCYIEYQVYDVNINGKPCKELEIEIGGQSLDSTQWEDLNQILNDYDLKILDLGIHGYDDGLYFDIIEKR